MANFNGDKEGITESRENDCNGTEDGSTTMYTYLNADGLPNLYNFDHDIAPNHLDLENNRILDNVEFQANRELVVKNKDLFKIELYFTMRPKILSLDGENIDGKQRINIEGITNGFYIVKIYVTI